jgi:hypothetical protein
MDARAQISDNIVQRLRSKLNEARSQGFKVRMEFFDEEQASWCVIAGVPTLFIDQSQTATEQLRQLQETLAAYQRVHSKAA